MYPDAGKDRGQEEKGATEDEMDEWHHWLNGHEFEQTPGDSEGQISLVCFSPWGRRVGRDLAIEQQQIKTMYFESALFQQHIISTFSPGSEQQILTDELRSFIS